MTRPLVSIIVANYNYGRFVAEAVQSALDQTYQPVEVIVVDDGSTDSSVEILRSLERSDQRLVVLEQSNAGHLAAVLAGVRATAGALVCLLDADDRFHPTKVERIVERFERDPELVQVTHHRQIIDADGAARRGRRPNLTEGDVVPHLLRWGRYEWMVTSCLAYRRDVLIQILEDSLGHPVGVVDLHTTAAAPFFGPVGAVHEILTDYRVHGSNMHQDAGNLQMWRSATIELINKWAGRRGFAGRVLAKDDNELVLLGRPPVAQRLRALYRSGLEAWALRRSAADAGLTGITRVALALHPPTGERMLLLGPARYLRSLARRRRP